MSKPLAAFAALLLLGGGVAAVSLGGGALRSKVEVSATRDAIADASTEPINGKQTGLPLRTTTASPEVRSLVPTEPSPPPGAPADAPMNDPRPSEPPADLPANPSENGDVASAERTPQSQSETRAVAPAEVPEPTTESAGLERVEPRAALSEIGQALPPKPKMPNEWKGTTLFNPVATAAGSLEARGYNIAIAGVEPIPPDEACDSAGKSWPCGVRARAAFRAWLRGRSVICEVPPQPDRETIVVPCRVGKKDVAEWLVESGWARAIPDGPYAGLQDAALKAKKGIFGAPPATTAASSSHAGSALPAPAASDTAILSGPVEEPEPDTGIIPPLLNGPLGDFPEAPAAPAGPTPEQPQP